MLYNNDMSISKQTNDKTTTTKQQHTNNSPANNQSKLKDKVAYKPLTRKQEAFVQELLTNPKQSATKAVLKTYNVTSAKSASVVATENLAKPSIISRLGQASDLVESALVNTVKDWGSSDRPREREIALDSAKFIHDKVHGKATQRVEQQTTTVSVAIDLSGMATTEQG